jgi:hypothetical protein
MLELDKVRQSGAAPLDSGGVRADAVALRRIVTGGP